MIRVFFLLIGLSANCLVLVADDPGTQTNVLTGEPRFPQEQIDFFESEVRPVLVQFCFDCHSTDAPELKAGLSLDSRAGMLKGGDSGTAVVLGKPAESLLIASIKYEASGMPPDRKLDRRSIEALTKWVEMGVPWPQSTSSAGDRVNANGKDWTKFDWDSAQRSHWAWQRIQRPDVPALPADAKQGDSILHPIDLFVASGRANANLPCVPVATPALLARRIYIDLIGILPTWPQISKFTSAAETNSQFAVESLVDELLESPLYGQRWGRHWLDVARYSDGHGGFLDNTEFSDAWRYRDWVVDAFNRDLPIDEFIRLQIAGDLRGEPSDAIATGFFALGPTYRSDGGDPDSIAQSQGETLDDRIDTLTRGLLGITGSCARCHDHKFDPIPQQDYYSLAGVFQNTSTRDLPLASDDVVQRFQDHKKNVDELAGKITPLTKKLKSENRQATADEQALLSDWMTRLEEFKRNSPPQLDIAHTLHDTGSDDMKVALRGNLRKTGDVAPRRFLRILSGSEPIHFTQGSGREELARAIADPLNPLTARVFVNRIWMHHFSAGLVRTPSNFGVLGESPTHPDLLDWLASEFLDSGWSLKALHRKIMTSQTYQLSSAFDEQSYKLDGDNRWLWRMSPRRMDVEAWRDSLLAVTGELDLALGGPSQPSLGGGKRRTLYAKVSRNGDAFESDSFLRRFDFPLMRATVEQRPASIVPQQFLFLMNSQFMIDRAEALANQLDQVCKSDVEKIETAYHRLYSRAPDSNELTLGLEFVRGINDGRALSGWARYAQVLLSSNEFMYVR